MKDASTTFANDLVARTPQLRGYARALSKDITLADDLVQETLLRAWRNRHTFSPGTNIGAWLNTILRNCFLSHIRRARRQSEHTDSDMLSTIGIAANQESSIAFKEVGEEVEVLPKHQREALLWVTVEGMTYEDAAQKSGCSIGTIKSRISRARKKLRPAAVA